MAKIIDSPSRATHIITKLGKSVVKENPTIVDQEYLMKFDSIKCFKKKIGNPDDVVQQVVVKATGESPQDMLDRAYQTITSTLVDDVLNEVMEQSSYFFEKLGVDLLVTMGYGGSKIKNSQVLGKTGYEGIDGIIKEDKLGFDKIYIQAKQWDVDRTVGSLRSKILSGH